MGVQRNSVFTILRAFPGRKGKLYGRKIVLLEAISLLEVVSTSFPNTRCVNKIKRRNGIEIVRELFPLSLILLPFLPLDNFYQ